MPRRGWTALETPSGWFEVIRGPRPPSVQWPVVSLGKGQGKGKGKGKPKPGTSKRSLSAAGESPKQQQKSDWDVPVLQPASRSPDKVSAEATEEVQRLEAALSALGEGNPHAKPLVEALRVARSKAKVLPVEEQIIACKNFVERAKKRVMRVQAVISRALEQKVVFETEVQEGEARLQQLEESHSHRPVDAAASVTELQRRIDDLTRERDSLRAATPRVFPRVSMADGPESIPPIPMSSVQDMEGWLRNRNCELRNALESGDVATVGRVGALVAHGSAQLASFVQGMQIVGDGQARSSLTAALIDQADAKRRCVEVVPSTLGNQV